MKSHTKLFLPLAALVLSACGGGGSDSSSSGNGDPGGGQGTTKTTAGVWEGTLTSTASGPQHLIGMTAASGQSLWMTTDGRVWSGQMPSSGTGFDVTMTGHMYPGSHFADGTNHGNGTLRFEHHGGDWNGRFAGWGEQGTFQVSMSPAWDRPASLALLSGTYTRTTSIGYTMTLSIDAAGVLTGGDSRGCVFSGNVSVPDPAHNLYQVSAAVTSCGVLDGDYQGHGTLVDASAMRSWLTEMGCFQYGNADWHGGGMMGGGMMGGWWPNQGVNTVPSGTGNLFMFAVTNGRYAIMDALAR